jgi:transposase/putative transposase
MKQKRRNHSPEFKARIALEAIRGVKTVQQIAADNHLHPVQVAQWKGQMLESAAGVFERAGSQEARAREEEKEKARLERKVGQLVVEVDWLKKNARSWGSIHEKGDGGEERLPAQCEAAV